MRVFDRNEMSLPGGLLAFLPFQQSQSRRRWQEVCHFYQHLVESQLSTFQLENADLLGLLALQQALELNIKGIIHEKLHLLCGLCRVVSRAPAAFALREAAPGVGILFQRDFRWRQGSQAGRREAIPGGGAVSDVIKSTLPKKENHELAEELLTRFPAVDRADLLKSMVSLCFYWMRWGSKREERQACDFLNELQRIAIRDSKPTTEVQP